MPPLAIIGIGSMFPKAEDLQAFWANIKEGVDAITDVPSTHWDPADYFSEDQKKPDFTYAKRGGFLPPIDFEPMKFGMPPNVLEATDTSQLLGMVVAERAMNDAGYGKDRDFDRDRVSVILGVTGTLELVIPLGARLGHPLWRKALTEAGLEPQVVDDLVQRISDQFVPWQENSFPGLLGNVVAGRISKYLDTGGTNCVVDAACASSLSALEMAAMELATGKADMVLTGGADTFNDIFMYMCFSKTPALSPTGNAKPFDQNCDGTILGEGLGMVVLKRLEDAERDGDKIYTVVKGIGSSSDGKGDAIYAPSSPGQVKALKNAYINAGVSPDSIELLEAHGTGTMRGDAVEAAALKEVFGNVDGKASWCAIGSIKSQIGHTKSAAGAAGIIKAALALHHKVLPPTIKVEQPAESLAPGTSPFYVNTVKRPWLARKDHARRAGVSSFGFGGSNFHLILEEYRPEKVQPDWDGDVQILAFSGATRNDLVDRLAELRADAAWPTLRGLAAASRSAFNAGAACRLLLVVDRAKCDLPKLIANASQRLKDPSDDRTWSTPDGAYFGSGPADGGLAIVFPGQGAQYTGMLRDLACQFPEMLDAFAAANDIYPPTAEGQRLSDFVYPHPTFDDESAKKNETALRATQTAQPAIGAASLGAFRVFQGFGLEPDAVAGHSYGELTALCAAGRLSDPDFMKASVLRGRLMGEGDGDRGSMLAVRAPLDVVQKAIDDAGLDLVLANKNAPEQAILSGATEEIERAAKLFAEKDLPATRLDVAAAFHSPFVSDASAPFMEGLKDIEFSDATLPVYANTTGEAYPEDEAEARELLAFQLSRPVEFVREIEAMHASGIRTFLEVGPGKRLTGLIAKILEGRDHGVVALDASNGKRSGICDLASALCAIAARGHGVDFAKWDEGAEALQEAADGKAKMTVSLSGANFRSEASKPEPKPPTAVQKVQATEAAKTIETPTPKPMLASPPTPAPFTTPQPAQTIPSAAPAGPIADLLAQSQANIAALQRLHEQTAQLHAQYLQGQEAASRTVHELIQQQQRLFSGAPQAPSPLPTVPLQAVSIPQVAQEAPVAPAPEGPEPTPAESNADRLHKVLLQVVSDKTGYPVDMLELDMALDADLGIDSIKRVEILSALQEEIPELPTLEAEELGAIQTLRDITDKLRAVAPRELPAEGPVTADAAKIQRLLLDVIADKTGYPVDMLEVEMQLDADLGIDSIKRVEILSVIQEKLPDLPPIEAEDLGSLQTIADVIDRLRAGVAASPAPAPKDAAQPESAAQDALQAMLLEVVADKTGYPAEMLELHMALDADLGIDSIKRVEILSVMQERAPDLPAVEAEEMGRLVTLQDVVDALASAKTTPDEAPREDSPETSAPPAGPLQRMVLKLSELPRAEKRPGLDLAKGAKIHVTDDGAGLSKEIVHELLEKSFDPTLVALNGEPDIPEDLAGLVIVAPTASSDPDFAKLAFTYTQAAASALRASAERDGALLATVARLDGGFGLQKPEAIANPASGGLAGLVKTVAQEWPELTCRAIDLAPELGDTRLAAARVVEEFSAAGPIEVGLSDDGAQGLDLIENAIPETTDSPALNSDDVIIISGGARGVTARCAVALAAAFRATLVLLGRSPAPVPEEEWSAALLTEAELKKALLERANGKLSPKALQKDYLALIANREILATFDAIRETGATAAYRSVDIRDAGAVATALDGVRREFGAITGLVHGAGVLADRRIEDKTLEQFDAVYGTKVDGMQSLLSATRDDALKTIILFSSSTARFGRAGQIDYAMANEVLNKTAQIESARRPECRVAALNWGPWAGGMVSPALRKVFEKEGVGLIGLDQGAEYLIEEISATGDRPAEVVVMGPGTRLDSVTAEPWEHTTDLKSSLAFDLSVERFPFLASHVIDGKAVLPLAMYMEWMAHAALHEHPGLRFQGIENLKVFKGVILQNGHSMPLEILTGKARKHGGRDVVPVELRSTKETGGSVLHARAEVILGTQFSAQEPELGDLDLPAYSGSQEEIYNHRLLFHGADFQNITSVDGCDDSGISVSAKSAPNPECWIQDPLRRRWIADPSAVDCAFQALILWSFSQRNAASLPVRFGRYEQFRTAFPKGGVQIAAHIDSFNDHKARATIEFLDPKDGSLVARIEDYECVIDASLNEAFQRNELAHESVGG